MTTTRTEFAKTVDAIAPKDDPHRWIAKVSGDLWLIGSCASVRITPPIANALRLCGIHVDEIELPALIAKAKGAGNLEVVAQGDEPGAQPPASIDRIFASVTVVDLELSPMECGVGRPMAEMGSTLCYLYGTPDTPVPINRRLVDLAEMAYPAGTWHQAKVNGPCAMFSVDGELMAITMPVRVS